MALPQKLQVNNLRVGEEIQYVLHRHWITLFYTGLYIALTLAVVAGALVYKTLMLGFIPASLMNLLVIGGLMVSTLFIYVYWVDNELDFFIVTNERIIGIEQLSFMNRTVRECSLDQVQEINGEARGLMQNLLNFGTVTIRTASETSEFSMMLAPEPIEHARIILNIIQEFKGTHRERMNSIRTNV